MNYLPEMNIRLRLTSWFLLTFTALILLLTLFFYWQTRRSLLAQMDATLILAANQARGNVNADTQSFQNEPELLNAINQIDNALTVQLVDSDGNLFQHLRNDGDGEDIGELPDLLPLVAPSNDATIVRNIDQSWRVYSLPVGSDVWIQAAQTLDVVEDVLTGLLLQLAWGIPLALLLAGGGGYWLAGRALSPIDRLTTTANAISATDLSQRIGYTGPADEVGRLASTFDRMLDRLQTAFDRERRFTGDAAHELRTPLTALKGRIGVTLSQPRQPEAYRETLLDMDEQVDRLIKLSNDLLFMAQLDENKFQPTMEETELDDFLGAVIDQIRPLAMEKRITLLAEIEPGLRLNGDIDLLIRLFLILLDNAVKYTPEAGQVTVAAKQNGAGILMGVQDTGIGIPETHLPHLFERFYRVAGDRGRLNGGGAGLGLAIAQEIVRAHEGRLWVESVMGEGSVFWVEMPASISSSS